MSDFTNPTLELTEPTKAAIKRAWLNRLASVNTDAAEFAGLAFNDLGEIELALRSAKLRPSLSNALSEFLSEHSKELDKQKQTVSVDQQEPR